MSILIRPGAARRENCNRRRIRQDHHDGRASKHLITEQTCILQQILVLMFNRLAIPPVPGTADAGRHITVDSRRCIPSTVAYHRFIPVNEAAVRSPTPRSTGSTRRVFFASTRGVARLERDPDYPVAVDGRAVTTISLWKGQSHPRSAPVTAVIPFSRWYYREYEKLRIQLRPSPSTTSSLVVGILEESARAAVVWRARAPSDRG